MQNGSHGVAGITLKPTSADLKIVEKRRVSGQQKVSGRRVRGWISVYVRDN